MTLTRTDPKSMDRVIFERFGNQGNENPAFVAFATTNVAYCGTMYRWYNLSSKGFLLQRYQ